MNLPCGSRRIDQAKSSSMRLPHGSCVWNRRTPASDSSRTTCSPASRRRSASASSSWSSSTASRACARPTRGESYSSGVHFFPYYPHYVQHSGVDWTAVAAIGTFAVVFVTAWLAVSTRKLARASTADQRAQWRPILTVDPEGQVDYDDATGEWSLELRN